MTWILFAVFLNGGSAGIVVTQTEMPSEDACAEAIKTLNAGIPGKISGVPIFGGATCLSRAQ